METKNTFYNIGITYIKGNRIFSSKVQKESKVKGYIRKAGDKIVAVKEHFRKVLVSDKVKRGMDKLRTVKNSIMLMGSKDFKGSAYELFFGTVGETLGIKMTKKGEQAYDAIIGNEAISLKTKKVERGLRGEFRLSLGDYSTKGLDKNNFDVKSVDDLVNLAKKIFKLDGKNDIDKASVIIGNPTIKEDRYGIEHHKIDIDNGLLNKDNIKSFKKTKEGIAIEMKDGSLVKIDYRTNYNGEISSINISRFENKADMYDNKYSHNLNIKNGKQEISVKSYKILNKENDELLKKLDEYSQLSRNDIRDELNHYFDRIGGRNLNDESKVFLLAIGDIGSVSDLSDPKKLNEIKSKLELYGKIYGLSEADLKKISEKIDKIGNHIGEMINHQKNIEENVELFVDGSIKTLHGFDITKIEGFGDIATILSTTRVMNQYSSNLYTKTLIDSKLTERNSELNSTQFLKGVNDYIQNGDIKGLKKYIKDNLGIEIKDDDLIFGIAEDIINIVGNVGEAKKSLYRLIKRNIGTRIALEDKLSSVGYLFEAEIGSLGGMIKGLSQTEGGIYLTPGLDIIDGFVKREELAKAMDSIEEIYGKSEFTNKLRDRINTLFGIKDPNKDGIQTFQLKATSSNRTFFNAPIIKDRDQLLKHMENKYGRGISEQLREKIQILEKKIDEYKKNGNEGLIDEISNLYSEISHSVIASKILFKNGKNKNNTSDTNIIDDHSVIIRSREGTNTIRDTKIEYNPGRIKQDLKKIIKESKNPGEAIDSLLSNQDINKGIRMEIENNDGSRYSVYKNGKNIEFRRIS